MANLRNSFSNMTAKGRLALLGGGLAVIVVAFLLFTLAGQKSFSTMMTGLEPAQTGKMTAALDEKGIAYELQNNGTALAVDPEQTAQARVALAEAGLEGGGKTQPGFELFDKQKLGVSDFQQQVNYQRALEGEIASTVGQVEGVSGAQVSLVLPKDELFEDAKTPASAAVLLTSSNLEPNAVRGIAQLVSSSVQGLDAEKVTITDQQGQLLWPQGSGDGGGTASKPAAEARYDQQLESQLNALLVQTVGPGKAQVQVNSDLDVNRTTEDKLEFEGEGVPLDERKETEQLEGAAGGAETGGAAGAAGNIPGYGGGAGAAGGGEANYNKEATETRFGVNKTVTRTKVAPGAVEKLDVALVVDKSVPPNQVRTLQDAVESAAGVDAERGDRMTVGQMTFAKPPAPPAEAGPIPGDMLGYAKYGVLGLGVLLFAFFVWRALRKRERDAITEPTWLREIEAPTSLAALEAAPGSAQPVAVGGPPEADHTEHHRRRVEEMANREPEALARHVRTWMNDG